jgi:hypothetical protein
MAALESRTAVHAITFHLLFLFLAAWFDAVRAFECLALIFLALCIGSEVYMDFLQNPAPDKRLVELFAILAGNKQLSHMHVAGYL